MKINKIIQISVIGLSMVIVLSGCNGPDKYKSTDTFPAIFPDYTNTTIPYNIAPINFLIKEKASKYCINIHSKNGKAIQLNQKSPEVTIPLAKWKKLLQLNKGEELNIDIYCYDKKWFRYKTIKNNISNDPIDDYLVYRLINAVYTYWNEMGIYQRNIGNFDVSPIFQNTTADGGCVNCHSFSANNPNKMSLHFRKVHAGTIILDNDKICKINTKTPYTMSAAVYPAWHPSGDYIAYSVNLINQYFTSDKTKLDEVTDQASDLILYNVKTNTVTTSPKISTKARENMPAWSPDGKMLYFISAPEVDKAGSNRANVKYSLLRIPFDKEKCEWGDADTVLSANKTGKSITMPQISPDGNFLVFAMGNIGYFTIFDLKSDLYIMDLRTMAYTKMNLNSSSSESYHSWSHNGRWLVFSSKRQDDVYSSPFIAYFDENGNTGKPFILPQKNPNFYNQSVYNFNKPELVTGRVPLSAMDMRNLVKGDAQNVLFDKNVNVDALSGATFIETNNPK